MSTTVYVTSIVILAIALVAIVLIAVGIVLRRRKQAKCTNCGHPLPAGTTRCPSCTTHTPANVPQAPSAPSLPRVSGSMEMVAVQGSLAPRRFPVSPTGLTIGRSDENDLVLVDEMMVSRHHAAVAVEDGEYVLYDRDSTNGIWVNDRRVFRHVLSTGDRIQVGQSVFLFGQVGTPMPPPARLAEHPTPSIQAVGEYFEGYYLERVVGRGGMSQVFKARDAAGRTVALKVLQETNPYLVDKFVQEGNKIGPLLHGHPNIVHVDRFDRAATGHLYLVMEFVDAPSLRRRMRDVSGEQEIVRIVGQVCHALAFAHENQIVHRDIKPENILLGEDGAVKVLDFGIAKLTSAATVTRDRIVGTPEYLSPEQARGDPVLPASDLYSLGIVLYELLAGTVPFPQIPGQEGYKAAMSVIRQHLHDQPEPIRRRNPAAIASGRLERVAMRALEKETKKRYKTATEMRQALGYDPQDAAPPPPTHRAQSALLIQKGPRQGHQIPLAGQQVTIGRADLDPDDLSISRSHATIVRRGDVYWIEDTSQNGTWVDNRRVYGEIPLRPGSYIVIRNNVMQLVDDCHFEQGGAHES